MFRVPGFVDTQVQTRNTKPLAVIGFSRVTLQGIFLNFQEHLLCTYNTLVLRKLFFEVLQQQTAFLRGKVPAINILLGRQQNQEHGTFRNIPE